MIHGTVYPFEVFKLLIDYGDNYTGKIKQKNTYNKKANNGNK